MRLSNGKVVFVQTGSVTLQNGFVWAKELARRIGVPFTVFLNLPHEYAGARLDMLNQLLEADGYYFTHTKLTDSPKTNPSIRIGDLYLNLLGHLNENPFDIIVLGECQSFFTAHQLQHLLNHENGFLLLPKSKAIDLEVENSFDDTFNSCTVYNLPLNLRYGVRTNLGVFNFVYPLFFRRHR